MEFEALQYQITMHNLGMGDAYFISQFIKGVNLKLGTLCKGRSLVPWKKQSGWPKSKSLSKTKLEADWSDRWGILRAMSRAKELNQNSSFQVDNSPRRGNYETIVGLITCVFIVRNLMMPLTRPSAVKGQRHKLMPLC
jgi:hypothetical protein